MPLIALPPFADAAADGTANDLFQIVDHLPQTSEIHPCAQANLEGQEYQIFGREVAGRARGEWAAPQPADA